MKVLIDACVLFPTVMREIALGVAATGLFTPLWSARILEEWARASVKLGPLGEVQARAEIAVLRADWPKADVTWNPSLEARLWLPDDNDVHVLAAAISGSADAIMTLNKKDFPRGTLMEEGLDRVEPDGFLYGLCLDHPEAVEEVGKAVLARANTMQEKAWDMRSLLKKARLPKLAKALSA